MANKIEFSFLCSEPFDKMTPVEGGRFCGSCNKKVHDWSHLPEETAAKKLAALKGQEVCCRIERETWHSTISIKKIPHWAKTFLVALLAAFGFLVGTPLAANGQKVEVEQLARVEPSMPSVRGKISLKGHGPLRSVKVKLCQGENIVYEVQTDHHGSFQFDSVTPGEYRIRIERFHFKPNFIPFEVIAAYSYQVTIKGKKRKKKLSGCPRF